MDIYHMVILPYMGIIYGARREEVWAPEEGGQQDLEGLQRQECIGVMSVFNLYSTCRQ